MSETLLGSMRLGSVDASDAAEELRQSRGGHNIFIFDGQSDAYLDHINRKYVTHNRHTQSLEDHIEMFRMTALGNGRYAKYLGDDNKLLVPGEDSELLEFRIFETARYRRDDRLFVDAYARASHFDLQTMRVFDPQKTDPLTASQHAEQALAGTGWQVGQVDFSGIRTLTFDNPFDPYAYLRRVAREFELEMRFYVTTDGEKVTGRYVDLVDRIGEWRGRTVEFGVDLQGIRRKEKTENRVTALYGYGPEREDGTRLKVFVEDEDARQRWGRNGRHIVDYYEPETEDQNMTESRLRTLTETELQKRINAVVEYEADIVDLENVPGMENKKIRFADTIRIKDTKFNPALYVEARIYKQERDVFVRANKHVELGDFVEYTEEEVKAIWRQLQEQIRQKISQAQLEEYAEIKVHRDTDPPQNVEHLWLDTTDELNVLKRYDGTKWVKATPTEADEVGAETPEGAQQKADEAKQEAISYSENFTINYAQKQITSSVTPPENPDVGDLWFDNSTQPPTFRRWNGTEWEKLSATTFEELEGMIDKSQLPDRVIDSMKLAIDAVQEENLSEDSVYAEAIQAEAVGAQAIAANAILAKHIAAGEVTANHLAAEAVTADAIAAGAILAEHLSARSIDSSKIVTEGLDADVIKTGTLTAIDIAGVTITGSLFQTSGAQGDIVVKDDFVRSVFTNPDGSSNYAILTSGYVYVEKATGGSTFENRSALHSDKLRFDFRLGNRMTLAREHLEWFEGDGADRYAVEVDTSENKRLRLTAPNGVSMTDLYISGHSRLTSSSSTARWYGPGSTSNNMYINSDGQVAIYADGSYKHVFRPDGSKIGGTVAVNGSVWGMSPIDSPQVPIEYFIFDVSVTETGTVIDLDEIFLQATEGPYAVFTSGEGITVEKDDTSFTLRGESQTADVRVVSLRRGYADQFWVDMSEEGGDDNEH